MINSIIVFSILIIVAIVGWTIGVLLGKRRFQLEQEKDYNRGLSARGVEVTWE